ncbi:MAG: hypothetical protein ACREJC_02030 [Tepidisphaeraceae bacterium]
MSAESLTQQLIEDQSKRSQQALDAAITYGDLAQTVAVALINLPPPPSVNTTPIVIPPPTTADQAAQWEAFFGSAFSMFGPEFNAAFNSFMDQFFPEADGCIRALSDAWICNTIQFGGTGIPATVETQIYDRARSHELELAQEATDNALDEWAGRGFSLPLGALTGRVVEVQRKTNDRLSTIRRDIAIKNIEIEIQNIRFAVEQAVNLRINAINAAVAYIRAFFLPTELAIAKANGMMSARLNFNSSVAAYYGAIIGSSRLVLEKDMFNSNLISKNNEQFTALVNSNVASRVNAAVGSATSLGRAAAAGLGSVNTLSNLAHITNKEE